MCRPRRGMQSKSLGAFHDRAGEIGQNAGVSWRERGPCAPFTPLFPHGGHLGSILQPPSFRALVFF